MPDQTMNPLVNLGDISKPADTLIKKVSKAVGGVFAPYQIIRVAKAEAEAAIIKAQTEIEITDLHRRAMHRFIEEEAKRQQNIENITGKAIPLLADESDAELIEDDWVTNFFDKSRIVSDNEMQELWARVLAGEVNSPGTYSKRTVNFVGDLDKSDAELFAKICGFALQIGNLVPLIFDEQDHIYNSTGINFSSLSHLESIGLIQFNNLQGFARLKLPKRIDVYYYGQPIHLELPKEDGENELELGRVLLTKIGHELAPICGSAPVGGFMDYVRTRWKDNIPDESNEQSDEPKPK
ncbi:MAG: DUF2806 domain-containing protein [Candidatus Marinimicrobia bacterium]|nr:DUF2806 domain-containing protein [Candidatus Neomarinimicrobiota bacterium]